MNSPNNVVDFGNYTSTKSLLSSIEAEQSVLGSLLLQNDILDDIGPIEAAHFTNSDHQEIYSAIASLIASSKPADPLTVHHKLKEVGADRGDNTLRYLIELSMSVVSARNAGQYAKIIREAAVRRTMVSAAEQARELALSHPDANEALDKAAALFAGLDHANAKKEPRLLADAIAARSAHWTALEAGEVTAGIATQVPTFDRAIGGGLKGGRVVVLAARPSVGKTSLAQQFSIAVAAQGHGTLICSQEMPEGELVDRAAAHLSGVGLAAISEGRMSPSDWSKVSAAMEQVLRYPLFIDDQPAMSLIDIRAKARMVQRKVNLKLLVIDYLQLCTAESQRGSRHHEIESISRGLKALAKELDVCVLLLSQLNRDVTKCNREPTLADLKESGAIEEDADVVVLLDPRGLLPDGSQLVAAILAKNRQGKRGRVALSFRGGTQRWVESTAEVSSRRNSDQPT